MTNNYELACDMSKRSLVFKYIRQCNSNCIHTLQTWITTTIPGKTQTLYENMLEELDSFGPFYPETVLCDFEKGLHNAIHTVWPGTTVRGCYFHHKQCLWRELQRCSLVPEYNVIDSPIRKYFKMIGAIAFLPLGDVRSTWDALKPEIPLDMSEFVDYYERVWIGTDDTPAMFDFWLWNQHDAVLAGIPRSNNIVEGWHNGFARLLGCSNPTIWKFLETVKKEQTLTCVKNVKCMMREEPEPQARKWRRYNERLDRLVDDVDSMESIDFIERVGNLLF